ncbi:MAG: hypothetical protein MJ252_27290 [archaeon]|nr:hypothetical protein [archaeon]
MEKKPARKRPSLITSNPLVQEEFIKKTSQRRVSVNWNLGGENFKSAHLQQIKTVLIEGKEEKKDKNKENEFRKARKKSVKDEFTMAKELLKNSKIDEELEENEEKIENTKKNIEMGKNFVEEEDSQSSHSEEEKKES